MNLNCFSCNVFLGKGRNVINIFDNECPLQSRKKICEVISEMVDRQITESLAHSKVVCKKCFGTISEYDSLNIRLKVLKSEYTQQLLKILPHYQLHYNTPKSVVLPASKLQPLPSNYVIDMAKVPVSKPTITLSNVAYKGVLPNLFKTTTTPKSSVNLKVTVGSTVLTQNLNSSITCQPKLLVSSTNTLTSSKKADTSINDKITTTITQSQTKNPVMSYNLSSMTKDFIVQNSGLIKIETDHDSENIDEQAMEIDEDCTLAVAVASDDQEEKNVFESSPNKKTNFDLGMLLSQEGITRDDKDGKYIIDRLRIIDQNDDDDDDDGEEVLVDEDGNRTTIIRVAAGQQVLYGGKQISLLQHDAADSLDSNDEGQIELQVSGDEETANAIIAAAQERGGAFIKVESGEMYRVQSIESKPDDEADTPQFQNIVERDGDLYKCLLCENNANREPGSGTGDAPAVMAHLRSAHAARAYICPACGLVMRKRSDYSRHIAEHASKGKTLINKSKLHVCTFCKKKYNSRTLLNEHLNVHAGTRPYACDSCGKTFASKYTHQAHLKTHSLRPRPFKCDQCDKTFFTQQNLSQHEKTHSGLKEFMCNVCGKSYATQHNLEVHGVVHTGRKPFPCLVCSKPFARRAEVRDHMRIHTGERPFACDICGATFTQRSNLHSHKRATHLDDKRYPCEVCPKRFKRKRLLEYHIKAAHTGERPLQCEVCNATFVYPEHYKKHGRIHSGERPYTCEVCGKTFNSRDNRNMHRFVHSNKKPYECLTCGAGYMRKRLLYAHMNTTGHVAESIVVNQPRVIKTTGEGTIPLIDVNAIQMKAEKFTQDSFQIFEAEELESEETQIGTVAVSEADNSKLYLVQEKKDSTVNLVQEGEESTFLTLHNFNGLIEATDDRQDDQIQMVTDENGETVRLIQVQLPGGQVGWIALDH